MALHPSETRDPVTTGDLLAAAREAQVRSWRAEADLLQVACGWADAHPPESISAAATLYAAGHGDTGIPIAGPGASLVAEFCLPEFAAVLGLSTDAGRDLVAEALELRDRLPKLWGRVQSVEDPVAPWRARRVARSTMTLSWEGARWVDAQVSPFAHRVGPAQLDRLVGEALARYQPKEAAQRAAEAAEHRHATLFFDTAAQIGATGTLTGTVELSARLDLLDAYDLDEALQQGAYRLQDLGSTDPLGVRRSHTLGDLARLQLTLDFPASDHDHTDADAGTAIDTTASPVPGGSRHVVKLHVHLTDAALKGLGQDNPGDRAGLDLARVEEHHQLLLAETLRTQLRTWLDRADLKIHVVPVIDLDQAVAVDSYEIPHRLHQQVVLRDHTCVFPWCTRSARACDLDHVVTYSDAGPPGQTSSENLAPLCRRHHRLKTFGGWTYTQVEPGVFLWTSPHGHAFLRDHTGTRRT